MSSPQKTSDIKNIRNIKASLFAVRRRPEEETMTHPAEVEEYSKYTNNAYLESLDNTLVDHTLRLGVRRGVALDVGTGPGQIPVKIAKRESRLKIYGIDTSDSMLMTAAQHAFNEGVQSRVIFQSGDAKSIPFDDHTFDMVLCNSVLHHMADPVGLFNEINRVVKPDGAILIRDFRRPLKGMLRIHISWFGRFYHGLLKELYAASVTASYTKNELTQILAASDIEGASVFTLGMTHLGVQRSRKN